MENWNIEETQEPSFLHDTQHNIVGKSVGKKKYEHVESKVRQYRKKIQEQTNLVKRRSLEAETARSELDESPDNVIEKLKTELENSKLEISNLQKTISGKDIQINFYKQELNKLSTCNPCRNTLPNKISIDSFCENLTDSPSLLHLSESTHHFSQITFSQSSENESAEVEECIKQSKLKIFSKASRASIRKIFNRSDKKSKVGQSNVSRKSLQSPRPSVERHAHFQSPRPTIERHGHLQSPRRNVERHVHLQSPRPNMDRHFVCNENTNLLPTTPKGTKHLLNNKNGEIEIANGNILTYFHSAHRIRKDSNSSEPMSPLPGTVRFLSPNVINYHYNSTPHHNNNENNRLREVECEVEKIKIAANNIASMLPWIQRCH